MPRLFPRQIFNRRFQPLWTGVCISNRHVRNKAIATFWKSLNKSRILSRIPQRTPKLGDGDVESLVEITETFVRPDSAAQFLPGDDFPRTLEQCLQQFHRLLLDSDFQTRFAHFARLERNLIGSESHDGGGLQRFHGVLWAQHGSVALRVRTLGFRIYTELTHSPANT